MSEFYYSPCTPADLDGITSVYLRAFADEELFTMWMPKSIEARASWAKARFTKQVSMPEIHMFKMTEGSPEGKIVAWARWAFPHTLSREEEEKRKQDKEREERDIAEGKTSRWPVGAVVEPIEKYFDAVDVMRKKHADNSSMYVMQFLATDPAYQRRGLGKTLLKNVLDRVDAEGRKTHIEATQDGHPLYLKLGWKDIDHIQIDLTKWGGDKDRPAENWVMVRQPQPTQGTH